ncbi:uncharacterized protein LY79DRAFT_549474 [Colletotrichum navitas]|uniref:Uncharacterized protein n=1 Tax=Colletotrichum navitas TaxID=681940 RepID=A0AAD8Q272_9PEZI|nr:uncharacterized protein LY79DRAFT_549474 [Colletotrichum navitas]KAK1594338.1 hypothetical protein LY79DRAFT_549474 [Colletotrichum navitas]
MEGSSPPRLEPDPFPQLPPLRAVAFDTSPSVTLIGLARGYFFYLSFFRMNSLSASVEISKKTTRQDVLPLPPFRGLEVWEEEVTRSGLAAQHSDCLLLLQPEGLLLPWSIVPLGSSGLCCLKWDAGIEFPLLRPLDWSRAGSSSPFGQWRAAGRSPCVEKQTSPV